MRDIHQLSDIIRTMQLNNPNHERFVIPDGIIDTIATAEKLLDTESYSSNLRPVPLALSHAYAHYGLSSDHEIKPGDRLRLSILDTETKKSNHVECQYIVWQLTRGEFLQIPVPNWVAKRVGSRLQTHEVKDYLTVPSNCTGFYICSNKAGYHLEYDEHGKLSNVKPFGSMTVTHFKVKGTMK